MLSAADTALDPGPIGATVSFRPARHDDLSFLKATERTAFPGDRLSPRALRHHIGNPRARFVVAVDAADRPLGYALVLTRKGSRRARLYSIARDVHRGAAGLGSQLLAAAEAAAAALGANQLDLEVRTDNARALRLYEDAGYVVRQRIPGYYEDGCAALRMTKALAPTGGACPTG
jgi:ribosomal protein S18 acetylase RimI-like enzyme